MKAKCIALMIVALLLIFPMTAKAQAGITPTDTTKTQQMKSIEGNIGYIDLMKPSQRYSFNVNFMPPDGISKVESVEITFMGDFATETIFSVNFNGVACSPDRWPTPKAGSSNYKMTFSCMAAIREAKDVNSFRIDAESDQDARNVIGWFRINYQSDWNLPSTIAEGILKPSMTMHGTEYVIGDKAKVWLQALDTNGVPVDNATCYVDIYTPFGIKIIDKAFMMFLENGIYYYELQIPNVVGVYPSIGLCYYSTATSSETADSAYVTIGTSAGGSYTNTQSSDNSYWNVDEALSGGIYRLRFGENFTNQQIPITTNINIVWEGRWNGGPEAVTINIWNYTTSTWIALPNTIPDTGAADLRVTNSFSIVNATIAGIVSPNATANESRIMLNDTGVADATKSRIRMDYLAIEYTKLSSAKATEIRGSSELHVSSISPLSKYIIVTDECGNTITGTEAAICGREINYTGDEMDFLEGEVEVNLTVTSLAVEEETETSWIYYSPITFDCTSLIWVMFFNGTEYIDVTENAILQSRLTDENCKIEMPISVNITGTYYYSIVMDNYLRWEIDWIETQRHIIMDFIKPRCDIYSGLFNYTYTVPIIEGTYISSDPYLMGCHRLYDDDYYIRRDYNNSLTKHTINELTVPFVEMRWYEGGLRHHMNVAQMESGFAIYDMTTVINASVLGNTPANMWAYPNRTLTDYNQTLTHSILQQINGSIDSIPSLISQLNSSINSISSKLDSINISLYDRMGGINASIMTKLYIMQNEMDAFNSSLYNHMSDLGIRLNAINQSISDLIMSVNVSISNELYPLVNELNQISSNLSAIVTLIGDVNGSLQVRLDTVDSGISGLYIQIGNINATTMTKLYAMQSEISSVNNSVLLINQSIGNRLDSIQSEFSQVNQSIYNRFGDTDTLILSVNDSLYNQIGSLRTDITSTFNLVMDTFSQLNLTNATIMNKLYLIQGDLADIYTINQQINDSLGSLNISIDLTPIENFLTLMNYTMVTGIIDLGNEGYSVNQSIMNKLYLIQGDIENLLDNLTIQLANVSNLSFNMTVDLAGIANDVWQLFFQRGTPPLAPSTDYYCSPVDSNILIKNITYNYQGSNPIAGYFSKEEAVLCSYGCINRTLFMGHADCDMDPTTKYGLAIGVAIIIIVAIFLIWKFVIVED
jgi:hypothetical protein